jgi:hypothetical protein
MTFRIRSRALGAIAYFSILAVACGSDDKPNDQGGACSVEQQSGCGEGMVCQEVSEGEPACFCNTATQTGCEADRVCEVVADGNSGCFAPVSVAGKVIDLASGDAVEGARVVARDANDASISGVAVTNASGEYTLNVPTTRAKDGKPVENRVTLRADASGYLMFPAAPRVALPFDIATATGDPPVLRSSATDVGLIALPAPADLGTITGKVNADAPMGTLVVAGGAAHQGGGVSGVADRDGTYTVFNVPPGSVNVRGYKLGLQLAPRTVSVAAGANAEKVDLNSTGAATAAVAGKISLVNPGDGSLTSVILAVDETFKDAVARGEAPPGLRVTGVTSDFRIEGVPDGNYVVLAAFDNDALVRDPDQSIGGTQIVRITVSGADVALPETFKVTGALAVTSPDKEASMKGTPQFVWADDSGEEHYEVRVFDAFGNMVWEDRNIPGVSGSKNVSVAYGGPALTPGLLYQFRATSIKRGGTAISATEDLRGTFFYE